jgi:predicted nicotinamide N-methyase
MIDLPAIPGGWTTRSVIVGTRMLRLTLPAIPDAFLDDVAVHAAHLRDEYMPYWAYLWPAAVAMADRVAAQPWPAGTAALEIGCGVGLVGLAGLSGGLQVTFSDYDRTAVDVAVYNARANGFEAADEMLLDWRDPPKRRFPLILGCDVVYETRNHAPILNLLDCMLAPDGIAWIGDAGRQLAAEFIRLAREHGYECALSDEHGRPLHEPRVGAFQLLTLSVARHSVS